MDVIYMLNMYCATSYQHINGCNICIYPFVSVYSDLVFKFDFKFKIKYAYFIILENFNGGGQVNIDRLR